MDTKIRLLQLNLKQVDLIELLAEKGITANKVEIKKAVEEIFGVKVKSVNTLNVDGKLKRQGKTQGYTNDFKKAYVTLTADSKAIEFFESLS